MTKLFISLISGISCGLLSVRNSDTSGVVGEYGDKLIVTCDVGHVAELGQRYNHVTCDHNGIWRNKPVCERKLSVSISLGFVLEMKIIIDLQHDRSTIQY